MNANTITTVRMVSVVTGSSDATGVLQANLPNVPNGTSDWSEYSSLYLQYRVLMFKATWVPFDVGFPSTAVANTQRPVVLWVVRQPTAVFASTYTNAFDNDGAMVRNIGQRFSTEVRMNGTSDAEWLQVASPSAYAAIGAFAASLTASSSYGQWYLEHLVQFRSRV
jgi:hypothetical protein